jgi:DnaJ-class molecular chaperone
VGSLYIDVEVADDKRFRRVGKDLVTTVGLGLDAATLHVTLLLCSP